MKSTKDLADMLNELFVRLRHEGALTWQDHPGTIGASLCWTERKTQKGRYAKTTNSSDVELAALASKKRLHGLLSLE